ncbi:hypothetical protein PCE1_001205 [Barthelona sp. PCE]
MAKTTRMSIEEKVSKILDFLSKQNRPFKVKSFPSVPGMTKSQIESALKDIEDNDTTNLEKVGVSKYIWSFPADEGVRVRTQMEATHKCKTEIEEELAIIQTAIEKAKADREGASDNYDEQYEDLKRMRQEVEQVDAQILNVEERDPQKILETHEKTVEHVEILNELVYSITQFFRYMKKERPDIKKEDLMKQIGYTEADLEYYDIEEKHLEKMEDYTNQMSQIEKSRTLGDEPTKLQATNETQSQTQEEESELDEVDEPEMDEPEMDEEEPEVDEEEPEVDEEELEVEEKQEVDQIDEAEKAEKGEFLW